MKSTLDRLQDELDSRTFVRVHRSTIVNLNHIRELRHWLRGTYRIILEDGTQLLLSRNHKDHLFNTLGMPIE
jgi:two-component system LytT family response regulator